MSMAFENLLRNNENEAKNEKILEKVKRQITNRVINTSAFLLLGGFKKMVEHNKNCKNNTIEKMRFVVKALKDKNYMYILQAWNSLLERWNMINGASLTKGIVLKETFIKRIMDSGLNLQYLVLRHLKDFKNLSKDMDSKNNHLKSQIVKRIINDNVRFLSMAFRQARKWAKKDAENEQFYTRKLKGIIRRMLDTSFNLMAQGFNKLMESYKERKAHAQNKLRAIINLLTNKEIAFALAAYNSLKQNSYYLTSGNVVDSSLNKINLIKMKKFVSRLTNTASNLQ